MSLYEHYDSELNKRSPWVVTPLDLYMKLMLILPITTLFQNYFDAVNKIVFMIFFIVGLYLITRNLWRNQFIYLVVALVSYIIVYMNSADKSFGNDKVYFISWIIYASYVAYNKVDIKTWLEDNEIFVRSIIKIWTILVVVSIPLSSSWFTKEGSGRYFGSYVQSSFRLCPTALFICALVLISISLYGRRRDIAYMILPLFCGVMGTSRTYAIVLIFVFMIGVYLNAGKKTWTFALRMLPVAIVGLGVYSYTSIADKVSYTMDDSQYGDFWYRITSSRSVIWEKQLEAFSKLTMIKKILGGGFGFTNSSANHYAHNDFIEVLCNHGYLGLIIYLLSVVLLLKSFSGVYEKAKIAFVLCVLVWLFNAMFNMFYYYTCAALCFPFILMAIECADIIEIDKQTEWTSDG